MTWNGGQPRNAQQLYGLAIPLLLNLMPVFSLIVRAIKSAIAIQGQFGTVHHQMGYRRKSAGQRQAGVNRGRRNLRLGSIESTCAEDTKRQQGDL